MRCYVDASFVAGAVLTGPERDAAQAFVAQRAADLVTTAIAGLELRPLMAGATAEQRTAAAKLFDSLHDLRFSDRGIEGASLVGRALEPFIALQVGAMRAAEDVNEVATYDERLALACRLFGIAVRSPGRPDDWYL